MQLNKYIRDALALLLAGTISIGSYAQNMPKPRPPSQEVINLSEINPETDKKQKYVLIVAVDQNKGPCWNYKKSASIENDYKQLLRIGFKKENIFVLDQSKNQVYPVNAIATKQNITLLLYHLGSHIVKTDDLFFMYVMAHGKAFETKGEKTSKVILVNGSMRDYELKKYIDFLHSNANIIFVDSCKSGGFADKFNTEQDIGISASPTTQNSDWMNLRNTSEELGKFNNLGDYFLEAFSDSSADTNHDGIVSVEEAFRYAKSKHSKAHKLANDEERNSSISPNEQCTYQPLKPHPPQFKTKRKDAGKISLKDY